MSNPVLWFEVLGQDADKMRAFYTQVPDLEAAIQQACELGSAVLMPISELPDTRIAVVNDPEGHPVGLCEPRA